MTATQLRCLRQLARYHGVQLTYTSMGGQEKAASPETLVAVLGILGCPVTNPNDVIDCLREARQAEWQRPLEPVSVVWNGRPSRIKVRLPAKLARQKTVFKIRLESGDELSLPRLIATGEGFDSNGVQIALHELAIPSLPLGYHRLEWAASDIPAQALIVSAPTRSYRPPGEHKRWGIFLPMYAAHSQRSWGAGNFGDWRSLSQWAGGLGASVAGSLPLLAAFLDCPVCEPSPYSPASRLFWNEFYLDIESVPEFTNSSEAQRRFRSTRFQCRLDHFRAGQQIEYAVQMAARREILEIMAKALLAGPGTRQQNFERALRDRPQIREYARFRAACEHLGGSWRNWPRLQHNGKLRPGDYSEEVAHYHAYVQWLAQSQVRQLVAASQAAGVKLYLDLPLGVHPDGYDVWKERGAFALGASAGAPPDPCFTKGQNWGFAPLHPQQIRDDGYRYVLEYLRLQMQQTGLLRIDHVMGLHRLYWIPKGLPASEGAYVRYRADEFYALLCLESTRHKTSLVGENLGTVPPEVNARLARHQIAEMYVLEYEQRPNPRQPLRLPPARSVASLNTHDMAMFAAHWRGKDIQDRSQLGLIPKRDLPRERVMRRQANAALARFLKRKGWLTSERPSVAAIMRACLSWLASTPAELLLVNLEDLGLEEAPQNVPGTSLERPNWRRKARWTLEQLETRQGLLETLRQIDRIRTKEKPKSDPRGAH